MIPNQVSMTNSRENDGVVRVPNGVALAIESVGDILMSFQSDFGEIDLQLLKVTFVPLLSRNLLSLKQFARRVGHSYRGDGDEVILFCKSGRWFFAPHCRELLLETTKQSGVTGELQECDGCSMAKGRRKSITKTTKNRAD